MMKLAIAATAMGVLLFGGAVAGQPSRRQRGSGGQGCRFDANVGRPPASNADQIRLCHYDHIRAFRKR